MVRKLAQFLFEQRKSRRRLIFLQLRDGRTNQCLQAINGQRSHESLAQPVGNRRQPHAVLASQVAQLPPGISAYALSQAPADGCYSLLSFYNEFLATPLASTDAAVVAAITPLEEWWRLASSHNAAATSPEPKP